MQRHFHKKSRTSYSSRPSNNCGTHLSPVETGSKKITISYPDCCANETTKAILKDIGNRNFSLLVNEVRDASIKEKIALVIRYLNNKGQIMERTLGLVHVNDKTSKSLKDEIYSLFAKYDLSLSRLRGLSFDGASTIRGEFNGLKSLILNENESAKYVHGFAHQLQLVVINVAKDHNAISDFFSIITMIVNTCGTSCKIKDKLQQIEHERIVARLESEEIAGGITKDQEMSLNRLGHTRWGSYFNTLLQLRSMWSSIINVLEDVYEYGSNLDTRGISKTLVMRMESFDFIFILHFMIEVCGSTYDLSCCLQRRDQNILQVISLIDATKNTLHNYRENGWDIILDQVEKFCVANSIDFVSMEDIIKTRVRMKRDGFVTNNHHYKVEIYFQVLDLLIQEMQHRFPEENKELLTCMNRLSPKNSFANFDNEELVRVPKNSFVNFDNKELVRVAKRFPDDFSWIELAELEYELLMYIRDISYQVEFSNIDDLGNLAKILVATERHEWFPLVYRLIELTLILPITSTSVERVFFGM